MPTPEEFPSLDGPFRTLVDAIHDAQRAPDPDQAFAELAESLRRFGVTPEFLWQEFQRQVEPKLGSIQAEIQALRFQQRGLDALRSPVESAWRDLCGDDEFPEALRESMSFPEVDDLLADLDKVRQQLATRTRTAADWATTVADLAPFARIQGSISMLRGTDPFERFAKALRKVAGEAETSGNKARSVYWYLSARLPEARGKTTDLDACARAFDLALADDRWVVARDAGRRLQAAALTAGDAARYAEISERVGSAAVRHGLPEFAVNSCLESALMLARSGNFPDAQRALDQAADHARGTVVFEARAQRIRAQVARLAGDTSGATSILRTLLPLATEAPEEAGRAALELHQLSRDAERKHEAKKTLDLAWELADRHRDARLGLLTLQALAEQQAERFQTRVLPELRRRRDEGDALAQQWLSSLGGGA